MTTTLTPNTERAGVREIIDLLQKTRDVVESGWMKGMFGDGQGRYCLSGALRLAESGYFKNGLREAGKEAYQLLCDQVNKWYGTTGINSVTGWNDAPDRTHRDVLTLIDDAIAEAEANR